MRNLRLYRIIRTAFVIAVVAWRYYWLQKREGWKRWRPTQEAWDRAHGKTGKAIYRLATNLGGAMVKLGQVLGARADVLPAAFVAPLRGLHDRVPARPFAKLAHHVERELGQPISDVFAHVEPMPIAAASLAQVHRARLVTGEDVVLKVQYPEARRLFPIDLGSLRRAVRVARWLNRGLDLRTLVDELAEFITLELDFEREAASTERVRANLTGDASVVVPVVHRASGKLLVLGFLTGTPLSALDKLRERGVDLRDVGRRVAALYAKMIFEHGFFHGDPHPGNILVLEDNRIGLLDFGLAKELPPGFAGHAARMIASTMAGNAPAAAAAAREIGFVIADDLVPELLVLVRSLMGDYENARNMLQHLRRDHLEIPSHFTLIIRALIILNGVSHTLAPGERVIAGAIAAALAPRIVAERMAR
ncbi:MAG TPA: AarF/UbiB family protein [Kofleriaceae bacterium]